MGGTEREPPPCLTNNGTHQGARGDAIWAYYSKDEMMLILSVLVFGLLVRSFLALFLASYIGYHERISFVCVAIGTERL